MTNDIFTQETVDKLNASALTFNEVVTSRSGGVSTGSLIDQTLTPLGETTDTLKGRLDKIGIIYTEWGSAIGGTLTSAAQAFLNNTVGSDGFGNYYSWSGAYPSGGHVVAPGTDPAAVGSGYTPRTDIMLRSELNNDGTINFSHANVYGVGALGSKFQKIVYPTDAPFNAVPDWAGGATGTDNYEALQAWMDYLCESGALGGIVGKFRTSQTILKKQAYGAYFPTIIGAGGELSQICGPANAPAIKAKGGSGAVVNAVISGVGLSSVDGTGTGFEPADIGGITLRNCRFSDVVAGIMPHNESSGGFTEFVVAENCHFTESCKQAIVYKRTGGDASFHGTGLRNCTIQESSTETKPKVEIGGALSTSQDIILYNAPMAFQCWKQTSTAVIRNNSTRPPCNTHGVMTFESFGGNQFELVASTKWNATAGQQLYHVGSIVDFNNLAKIGLMRQMQNLAVLSNGTIRGLRDPYIVPVATMAAGAVANTITSLPFVDGELFQVVIDMKSSASPCSKVFVLQCYQYSGVSSVFTTSKPVAYYDGDLGDPTFSMSGNNLIATGAGNWQSNTVTISATVTQMSGSRSSKI